MDCDSNSNKIAQFPGGHEPTIDHVDNANQLYRNGHKSMINGDYKDMKRYFTACLAIDPYNPNVFFVLAYYYHDKYDKKIKMNKIEKYKERIVAYYNQVIQIYLEYKNNQQDYLNALHNLVLYYISEKNEPLMLQALSGLDGLDLYNLYYTVGLFYKKICDTDKMIYFYGMAENQINDYVAASELVKYYLTIKSYVSVLLLIQKYEQLGKPVCCWKAKYCHETSTICDYEKILKENYQTCLCCLADLCDLYFKNGNVTDAVQLLEIGMSKNHLRSFIRYALYCDMVLKDYPAAEIAYLKTLSINDKQITALYNLASLYEESGREQEMLIYYEKALVLGDAESGYRISHYYRKKNKADMMLFYLHKAAELKFPTAIHELNVYTQLKSQAIQAYENIQLEQLQVLKTQFEKEKFPLDTELQTCFAVLMKDYDFDEIAKGIEELAIVKKEISQ